FATIGYFAFATQLWLDGLWRGRAALIALLSLGALLFSTSSTAYLGATLFLALVFLHCAWRITRGGVRPVVGVILLVVPLVVAIGTAFLLLNPELSRSADDTFNTILWNKMSSSSGVERSTWNAQAITNFYDTYGLGA